MGIRNLSKPGEDPKNGDWIEKDLDGGGTIQHEYSDGTPVEAGPETDEEIALRDKDLAEIGREWRDRELAETDLAAQTPDYPNRDAYLTYRTELRDWPSTGDFPATKPTLGS